MKLFGGKLEAPGVSVEDEVLQLARVQAARKRLEEITPAERLVERGPFLVDEETDAMLQPYRGAGFERGTARLVSDVGPSHFYVDRDGDVVLLERVPGPRTWSEHVERRARAEARTRPPL